MAFLPKAIYRFGATSVKIPGTAFTDTEEKNPKIYMAAQKTKDSQCRKDTVGKSAQLVSTYHTKP